MLTFSCTVLRIEPPPPLLDWVFAALVELRNKRERRDTQPSLAVSVSSRVHRRLNTWLLESHGWVYDDHFTQSAEGAALLHTSLAFARNAKMAGVGVGCPTSFRYLRPGCAMLQDFEWPLVWLANDPGETVGRF